jgi:hypothetical protein
MKTTHDFGEDDAEDFGRRLIVISEPAARRASVHTREKREMAFGFPGNAMTARSRKRIGWTFLSVRSDCFRSGTSAGEVPRKFRPSIFLAPASDPPNTARMNNPQRTDTN